MVKFKVICMNCGEEAIITQGMNTDNPDIQIYIWDRDDINIQCGKCGVRIDED